METKLAPPGAGLPWIQSLYLRYYMGPFVAARADVGQNERDFALIHGKILNAVNATPLDLRNQKVLIPPLPGLEDSSRFWSMTMTLEHILIVGEGIKAVVQQLASGHSPGLSLSTANVKPLGQTDADVILKRFQVYTETTMADLHLYMRAPNLQATQDHPWFGTFNARQWHWLLATHGGIHYRQIKKIRENLTSPHG